MFLTAAGALVMALGTQDAEGISIPIIINNSGRDGYCEVYSDALHRQVNRVSNNTVSFWDVDIEGGSPFETYQPFTAAVITTNFSLDLNGEVASCHYFIQTVRLRVTGGDYALRAINFPTARELDRDQDPHRLLGTYLAAIYRVYDQDD